MSELQAEDVDVGYEIETEEPEPIEAEPEQPNESEASELAPDAGEEPKEKTKFTEDQQRIVDDIVAKKTYKIRETERQAEELKQKLAELEARLPKEQAPDIPPIPDAWDDDFEQKMQARDQAIQDRAAYNARQRAAEDQRIELERQQLANKQKAFTEKVTTYSERAKKLGMSAEDLAKAGQTVAKFGIKEEIAEYILEDEQGPMITAYLSRNLGELEKLSTMSPMRASAYIENVVRKNAGVSGKKRTQAPDPVEPLRGSGAKLDHPALDGAKFE